MPIYQTKGVLTHAIPAAGVALAQDYLRQYDMTEFLDARIRLAVERIQWSLAGDGLNWEVEVIARTELWPELLKELSSWVSGQNSDGLGEGFEQQPWAWVDDAPGCDEAFCTDDHYEEDSGRMCSFDWETNDCTFERVV